MRGVGCQLSIYMRFVNEIESVSDKIKYRLDFDGKDVGRDVFFFCYGVSPGNNSNSIFQRNLSKRVWQ